VTTAKHATDLTKLQGQQQHRRVLQYNGCKWLGGVLRVEKAKENHLARLQREWTAKSDVEDDTMAELNVAQDQSLQTEPLRIPTPASGFVKRKVRMHFATWIYPIHQMPASSQGSWPNACFVYNMLRQNCQQVHDDNCHSNVC
jgi:hypothetical protein